MKFPQDFIDRVRESTNLVDVISQYVQLRRTGGNYQGLCPFHGEKTPSFSVSEDKQVYHCFGCKASGNVYNFVQNYQGLSFPEAVEYLARRAGLPIPETEAEGGDSKRDLRNTLLKINALAEQFYHRELKKLAADHPARKYLIERGLSEELVDRFKLGYSPGWSDLADQFTAKRMPMTAAEATGLIKKRGAGKDGHYDLFHHRLLFPIHSPTGSCLGFGGRVLDKAQQPKYLNSPDSVIFHKGKVFYGLDHSAKFIRTHDEVIVVEGYMDWLALVKAGFENVVATLGTALTTDHAKLIKRYTKKVLLLFDGDEAGKSAARRSLPILLQENLFTRGLFLPDQLDPDEYIIEHGKESLRELLQSAPDLFDVLAQEQWLEAKGLPSGKVRVLDELAPVLSAVQDARLRSLYVQNLASWLDVEPRIVEQSLSSGQQKRPAVAGMPAQNAAPAPNTFDLTKASRVEIEFLNVILLKEVYLKEAMAASVSDQLRDPGARGVFQRITHVYGQMPSKFDNLTALLANEVKPVETITRHLSEPYAQLSDEAATKLLQDCIKRVKENYLRFKSKELVSNLRGAGDANSKDQLEQIMNIHKSRRSLSRNS